MGKKLPPESGRQPSAFTQALAKQDHGQQFSQARRSVVCIRLHSTGVTRFNAKGWPSSFVSKAKREGNFMFEHKGVGTVPLRPYLNQETIMNSNILVPLLKLGNPNKLSVKALGCRFYGETLRQVERPWKLRCASHRGQDHSKWVLNKRQVIQTCEGVGPNV